MRPSGDSDASAPPPFVSCTGSPPSSGNFQICSDPERPDVRYMERSFRDQAGSASNSPSLLVSRDGLPPSASITYVRYLPDGPVVAKKAMRRPSGDHCGPTRTGPLMDVRRTGLEPSLALNQIS